MNLRDLVAYLNRYLEIHAYSDASVNGLQVENSGTISKIGLAVDACLESIIQATQAKCNFILVHHGLLWGTLPTIEGHFYRRLRALIHSDTALYAAHLPLDAHHEVGNNIQVAKRLDLKDTVPFGNYGGSPIGIQGCLPTTLSCEAALNLCRHAIGPEKIVFRFGPEKVSKIGVVTGSASDPFLLEEALQSGIDLFVTGEAKHSAYSLAQELGLNIFYGGHYQTETFGLAALGSHLSEHFKLPVEFLNTACPL